MWQRFRERYLSALKKRSAAVLSLLLIATVTTSCDPKQGTGKTFVSGYCSLDEPIHPTVDDVLSPELEEAIIRHNKDYYCTCDERFTKEDCE